MGVKVRFSLRRQVLYPTELRAQPSIDRRLQLAPRRQSLRPAEDPSSSVAGRSTATRHHLVPNEPARTPHANLNRCMPSGTNYARLRARCKLIWRTPSNRRCQPKSQEHQAGTRHSAQQNHFGANNRMHGFQNPVPQTPANSPRSGEYFTAIRRTIQDTVRQVLTDTPSSRTKGLCKPRPPSQKVAAQVTPDPADG